MSDPGGRYRVELLDEQHDRTAFSCGVEALDRYFRRQAGQDMRRNVAVVFVAVDRESGAAAGYYTLSTIAFHPKSAPEALRQRLPRYDLPPAMLTGRLAIDRHYQGQGLGKALLSNALRRCRKLSTEIGAIGVIVDAKDDHARAFYERFPFIRFVDEEHRLLIPMSTIDRLLA